MRSYLFVPADSPRKLAKALESGADALLIDLEDSVAPGGKEAARRNAADFVREHRGAGAPRLFVRVNALDTGLIEADLDAVMPAAPDGIMLPKACGGIDVQHLAAKLAVREAECGLPDGGTVIIAIATETARALFEMGTYRGASHRLAGLTWGAEDLSADIGAETSQDEAGAYTAPYTLACTLTLLAAAAAEVAAIDSVHPNYRDEAGLASRCAAARRDGFTAKMAIHPAQVPVINAAFTPSAAMVTRARRIVEAFAAQPGVGVIGLDGEMLDRPHLRRAERLLGRAGQSLAREG
jgi:citrate lyase subunit beta / citryl-CoA lyase